MGVSELRRREAAVRAEIRSIGDAICSENRAMTAEERGRFEALKADLAWLVEEVRAARATAGKATA